MYYDYNKILSYNAMLNILIGERGVGKTYGCTKYVIKRFINKHKKFVLLRRFKTELKKAAPNFFNDMIDVFPDHKLECKNNKFYVDDKLAGYAITLTEAQNIKGTKFKDVDSIIFDEFIIEDNLHYYLPNEVSTFLGICESIARTNNFKAFLLGNAGR